MVQETGKIGQCREFLPLLCVCFLFLSAYNCFIIISLSPSHDKFTSSFFHLSLSLSLSVFSFACACERSQQLHHHHNSTVTDFQGFLVLLVYYTLTSACAGEMCLSWKFSFVLSVPHFSLAIYTSRIFSSSFWLWK